MMLLLVAVGCMSYAEGRAQQGELNCALMDQCGTLAVLGYDTVEACQEAARAQPYDDADCPSYDAGAMSDCLDAYQAALDDGDCDPDLSACGSVCS